MNKRTAAFVFICVTHAAAPAGADSEDWLPALEKAFMRLLAPGAVKNPPEETAIGIITIRTASGKRSQCTAFLTGPDTAVTAAHCVMYYSGELYEPGEVIFYGINRRSGIGRRRLSSPAAEFLHVGGYTQYRAAGSTFGEYLAPMGRDIAVLRLRDPLGDTFGWLRKGEVDWNEIAAGAEYKIAGAPDGFLIRMPSCRVHPDVTRMWEGIYANVHSAFERRVFFHTCPTRPGYSGSPVLREDNGELTWIGVHSSRITLRWTGYPPVEGVGTAMILHPDEDGRP